MTGMIFQYGQRELDHLKAKDAKLAAVIDQVGMIERAVIPDLFSALMNCIIGQQISTTAHASIWERMQRMLPEITPQMVAGLSAAELQSVGLSWRKVSYMQEIADQVARGEFDLQRLATLDDAEVCAELVQLKGIGIWSAEMLMLFSMQRPNILSRGDLAIQRGLRMLYHHRSVSDKNFRRYWRRYTPYASVASLYLWAIAGGAIPEMKDYAPKKRASRKG